MVPYRSDFKINQSGTTSEYFDPLQTHDTRHTLTHFASHTLPVYSRNDPKSPISQAILDLIKEKRRLRWLYNNTQDPNIKSTINKLQKEIRTKINQESTISWEKFCNSISLESDPKKSWRKITNFLEPKSPRSYPTLKLGNKTAKTNPEKAQLFAESVERNFSIESHLFSKSQFDRINKFVEAHSYHFTPLDSLHDNITDTDDDSDLVADVDPCRHPYSHSTN